MFFYDFSDKPKNVCFENLYSNYHNKDYIKILNRQQFKNELKQKVEEAIFVKDHLNFYIKCLQKKILIHWLVKI